MMFMRCVFLSGFLNKSICCGYLFELHRLVYPENIYLFKEVDKKYTGCNLNTMQLLDSALIGVYGVIRSNTAVSFSADRSKTVPLLQFFSLRESAFVNVTFFFHCLFLFSIRLSIGCASCLRLFVGNFIYILKHNELKIQTSQNTGYTDIHHENIPI